MKKFLYFPILLFIITFETNAQEIIAAGGEYYKNTNVSVSWTLGEPIIETISNGSNIVTQGFQQSKLSASEIFSLSSDNFLINLFPNPTENIVNLRTEKYKNFTFQITDTNGKILKEGKITGEETNISMNTYPATIYFLRISDKKRIIKIFKIIKQ